MHPSPSPLGPLPSGAGPLQFTAQRKTHPSAASEDPYAILSVLLPPLFGTTTYSTDGLQVFWFGRSMSVTCHERQSALAGSGLNPSTVHWSAATDAVGLAHMFLVGGPDQAELAKPTQLLALEILTARQTDPATRLLQESGSLHLSQCAPRTPFSTHNIRNQCPFSQI